MSQQSPVRQSKPPAHHPSTPNTNRHPLEPVHQSQWQRDDQVTQCEKCKTEFGLFTRRHHCRFCGRIFCGRCSDRKWTIEGQPSRVCDSCFHQLNEVTRARLKSQQVSQYERPRGNTGEGDLLQQISVAATSISAIFIDGDPNYKPPTSPRNNQPHHSHAHHPSAHANQQGAPATAATASSTSSSTTASAGAVTTANDSAQAVANLAAAQVQRESVERLIYHTASLCPKCSLIEKRGFDQYKPAQLFEQYRGIWLRLQCASHGPHVTLVCKERNFWWRCQSYQERWIAALKSSGLVPDVPATIHQGIAIDMEDIGKMLYETLKSSQPPVDNLPLSLELPMYVHDTFVSDQDLDTRLVSFVSKFPDQGRGSTFLLKLVGGLVEKHDIHILNQKILRIVAMASTVTPNPNAHQILTPAMLNVRILVDVTYERLVDLLLLEKSCFLKVRVLPCVRYFLGPGEETQFMEEMDYLISLVKGITDLELVLSLSLEPPYPDMMKLLTYIQSQKGIIRFILISRERSPRDILNRLHEELRVNKNAAPMPSAASQPQANMGVYPESIDPYELLENLESGTQGLLRPTDFVPLSIAQIFEPVLQAFGYGSYHLNPSPFCGFIATLITTDKLQSIPITRLFDIEQLYTLLIPIAQKLKYSKEKPSIGIMIAKQIQKAMKTSAYNVETPDVVSYVASGSIDKSRSATIQSFVRNLQLIVIHNKMDFAAVSEERDGDNVTLE